MTGKAVVDAGSKMLSDAVYGGPGGEGWARVLDRRRHDSRDQRGARDL